MSIDFEHSFGFLVYDIARLLREQFNERASTLDLTQAQSRALVHLKRNEGVNQTTLASLLDVQPITLLRQLDKLEEKGLIERRADDHDRRMQRLYLTPVAETLIDQLARMGGAMTDDAFAGISDDAREAVMATLQTVKGNLTRDAGEGR
jgi:MarR family transcriptional regulator for hemolysin